MSDHFWLRQSVLWFLMGIVAWLVFALSIAQYQAQSEGGTSYSIYPLLAISSLAILPSLYLSKHPFEAILAVAVGLALGVGFLALHIWLMFSGGGSLLSIFVKAWFVSSAMVYQIAPMLLFFSVLGYVLRRVRLRWGTRAKLLKNA